MTRLCWAEAEAGPGEGSELSVACEVVSAGAWSGVGAADLEMLAAGEAGFAEVSAVGVVCFGLIVLAEVVGFLVSEEDAAAIFGDTGP